MAIQALRNKASRRSVVAASATALIALGLLTTAGTAHAEGQYQILGTQIGIYPRQSPDMNSAKIGTALPDGTTVTIACQTATATTAVYGNPIWDRLTDGTWLPDTFINTGTDGFDDRLPRCDTPTGEETPTAFGNPCADLTVIAVPGSGEIREDADPNRTHGTLTEVTNQLAGTNPKRVRIHYVGYPAELPPTGDRLVPYFTSKNKGYQAAWSTVNTYAHDCPRTKFVLLGYSQGAHVVGDLANTIADSSSPVAPDQIAAVGLLADPARNPHSKANRYPDKPVGHGIIGQRAEFGTLTDRSVELCHNLDPVCNTFGGPAVTLAQLAAGFQKTFHTSYNRLAPDAHTPNFVTLLALLLQPDMDVPATYSS